MHPLLGRTSRLGGGQTMIEADQIQLANVGGGTKLTFSSRWAGRPLASGIRHSSPNGMASGPASATEPCVTASSSAGRSRPTLQRHSFPGVDRQKPASRVGDSRGESQVATRRAGALRDGPRRRVR